MTTLCFLFAAAACSAETARPNVLVIIVDDFGARDLSSAGSTLYETPRMDRLASESTSFSQAYVVYPRCVPSRFGIMTGKHPAAFQRDRDSVHVEPGRDGTFGEAFRDAGYDTFYCGKWHLGDGDDRSAVNGFETVVAAGKAGATRSHFAPYDVAKRGRGEKETVPDLDDAQEGEYLTDRLTDETIKFLERDRDRPFLAVLAHYAVHTPIEAKAHLTKRYQAKLDGMELPAEAYEPEGAGENLMVQNNATYAAMVESTDKSVGRLMRTLDRLTLADDTIVLLTSDHGGLSARGNKREVATSNRPLRAGKGHLYEGGLRVPLFIRWPGRIDAGRAVDTPVLTTDLFPTLLELAGLPLQPTDHLDGASHSAVLTGTGAETSAANRPLFWHNPAPRPSSTGDQFSSAIRMGDLKLLEFPTLGRVELYDLAADIGEANDLSETRPDDRDRLLAKLHEWKRSVGAKDKPRLRTKERKKQ